MSELTKFEGYDQDCSTKTSWMYYADEVDEVISTLKEKNERLLRELSDACSKIVDLEAGEEILKARVAELEEGIARCRYQASWLIGNEEDLRRLISLNVLFAALIRSLFTRVMRIQNRKQLLSSVQSAELSAPIK